MDAMGYYYTQLFVGLQAMKSLQSSGLVAFPGVFMWGS